MGHTMRTLNTLNNSIFFMFFTNICLIFIASSSSLSKVSKSEVNGIKSQLDDTKINKEKRMIGPLSVLSHLLGVKSEKKWKRQSKDQKLDNLKNLNKSFNENWQELVKLLNCYEMENCPIPRRQFSNIVQDIRKIIESMKGYSRQKLNRYRIH